MQSDTPPPVERAQRLVSVLANELAKPEDVEAFLTRLPYPETAKLSGLLSEAGPEAVWGPLERRLADEESDWDLQEVLGVAMDAQPDSGELAALRDELFPAGGMEGAEALEGELEGAGEEKGEEGESEHEGEFETEVRTKGGTTTPAKKQRARRRGSEDLETALRRLTPHPETQVELVAGLSFASRWALSEGSSLDSRSLFGALLSTDLLGIPPPDSVREGFPWARVDPADSAGSRRHPLGIPKGIVSTSSSRPASPDEVLPPVSRVVYREVFDALEAAAIWARRTVGSDTGVRTRHVLAALLWSQPKNERVTRLRRFLDQKSFYPGDEEAARAFLAAVRKHHADEDNLGAWADILSVESPAIPETTSSESPADRASASASSVNPAYAGTWADLSEGDDLLGIQRDVDSISTVIAAKNARLPLSLGLFGDWGSGKTFFMNKMLDRIDRLSRESDEAAAAERPTAFCRHVVQIEFNAWHYVDSNLWASLVTGIFDKLHQHVAERSGDGGDAWDKARERLEEVRGLHQEALAAREEAESAANEAREKLQAAQEARLGEEESRYLLERLLGDAFETTKSEVRRIAGWDETVRTIDDLDTVIGEVKSHSSRASRIVEELFDSKNRWRNLALMVGVFLVPLFVQIVFRELFQIENVMTRLTTVLAQVGSFAAAVVAWLQKPVAQVGEGIRRLEELRANARAAQQKVLDGMRKDDKLQALLEAEDAAKKALNEAEREVIEAEAELREARPSRRLYRLIEDRIQSEDYRQRLGIISLIRRDLEELSKLVVPERGVDGSPPKPELRDELPIDRIILYIDDLDRCPADRVVEVLEAVHLLLAFPLFVVVVGVDPRWLRRSLELHYPHLLTSVPTVNGDEEEDRDGDAAERRADSAPAGRGAQPRRGGGERRGASTARAATPQNYLEKIFQIPFTLAPLGPGGYGKLIGALTEENAPVPAAVGGDADAGNGARESERAGAERSASRPVPGERPVGDPNRKPRPGEATPRTDAGGTPPPEETPVDGADETGDAPGSTPQSGSVRGPRRSSRRRLRGEDLPPLPLTPDTLRLSPDETKKMRSLHALFRTPRTVKRFVNTYRLLRARLHPGELEAFLAPATDDGNYEHAMLLLAILTAHPEFAPWILDRLVRALRPSERGAEKPPTQWGEFLASLEGSSPWSTDASVTYVARDVREVQDRWWSLIETLKSKSKDSPGLLDDRLSRFGFWVGRVSRFSFWVFLDEHRSDRSPTEPESPPPPPEAPAPRS